jgi:nucleotide-binding universal stress UspA family protein
MKNIILATDFSESTRGILDVAIEAARVYSAHLYLIHVAAPDPDFVGYEAGPQSVRDAIAEHYHQEHRELADLAGEARQRDIDATALLIQGPTVEMLILERKRLQAELIVAGSHGRSAITQLVLGSTSEGLIRKAGCPIMIVPYGVTGE